MSRETETRLTDCAQHPGAWAANCATCNAITAAYVAEHGEWHIGDTGECDFTAFHNSVLAAIASLPVSGRNDDDA